MTGEPFYLTPSRVTEALQCGLRYHRNYIQKLPHGKDGLARFQGDMQHQTLHRWGREGTPIPEAWEAVWEENLPDGYRSIFDDIRVVWAQQSAIRAKLETTAAEILAARPDVKQPRATKEYKAAAAELGSVRLVKELERLEGVERGWWKGEASPWRVSGPPPSIVFLEGGAALDKFAEWWAGLGEPSIDAPEIIHTEVRGEIHLPGGRNGFKVVGVIDAIYLWPDGRTEVVDYKRGRAGDGDLAHFVQSSIYALTCQELLGFTPDVVTFHYLKDADRARYAVREGWTPRLTELLERVERMHEDSEFGPSFRTCNWCDYASLCRDYFEFSPIDETPSDLPQKEAAA